MCSSDLWENIYAVKSKIQSSNVKVIGNGDIKKYDDIIKSMKNLDGVAIGRGAIGNPFIFNPNFEKLLEAKKLALKKETVLKHARLAFKIKGEKGIIELRKHLPAYFKGHPQAKKLRKEFIKVESLKNIEGILEIIKNY